MRRLRLCSLLLAFSALAAACGEAQLRNGAVGPQGPAGEPGPEGPAGPLGTPPAIAALAPAWGSATTQVTLTGTGFSATLADNKVTFDGARATVLSASATQLVVEPSSRVAVSRTVAVAVEVARQLSNPMSFTLVPSGTAATEPALLPSAPTAAVKIGADLYVASAQLTSPGGGLYKVDAAGRAVRVLDAGSLLIAPQPGATPFRVYDVPLALATDGAVLWFTSALGSVRRYDPATGAVTEIFSRTGPGDAFPALSGLARDAAGNLYVVDRNLPGVIRISPTRRAVQIATIAGAYGVAASGTTVFVTDGASVARIANADTAPVLNAAFATGAGPGGRGIAVVSGFLIVSRADGTLVSVSATAGGAMSAHLDAAGYRYRADSLWASGGDLYLAQPDGSCVRHIAASTTAGRIVSAGMRPTFATARIGERMFLATVGPDIFEGGPGGAPDAAVIEISQGGLESRVLARGQLMAGLIPFGGKLAVSDCLAGTISSIDPDTGASTDLLALVRCPTGLLAGPANELLYLHGDPFGADGSSVGKYTASSNTPAFVTGLGRVIFLTRGGGKLLAAGIGPGGAPSPIYAANAGGGAAAELVSAGTAGGVSALATGPDGTVFVGRLGGQLLTLDPLTGELSPFTFAVVGSVGQGPGSLFLSMAFKDDGTILLPDFGQGTVVAVAP